MMAESVGEIKFREQYGHSSICNCIRRWRGRSLVTRRMCDCGYSGMTRKKAFNQAVQELGELSSENHVAIVTRVQELEHGPVGEAGQV